ncbi:efflux RND transporter periplasmic adaptor subunit [Agrobacterium tumefaciens]|uniref:efflux RND transporter periplasmic adaptor subunit n=1 Tax=Agrobacterium tumefaciens TaxID=358 RepID=UPI00287D45BD|nr:efflux RND transporter periplasmic adaptor subunit [Agrobacterium tumefaciens]MDS7597809.1 efflux RND transporter periplasmic adaptor subunit [Agrobacterium tumefaciens]
MQYKSKLGQVAFLLLCATALPFSARAEGESPAAAAQQNLPSIIVVHATQRALVDRVIATGTIKPVDEIYVQPLVDGLSIDKLNADIGDKVEANAVLAELSTDSLLLQKSQYEANRAKAVASLTQSKAQVLEAEANLNDAVRQRDRAAKLGQAGSGSVSQVEQTQAAAEVAKARLDAAKQAVTAGEADIKVVDAQLDDVNLRLTRTGVKTPVAGIVSAKNAKVGAVASGAGTPLFTIIKDGAIELVADLSETDIQKIKVGQKAHLTIAGGAEKIEGKVRLVSPTVDAATRLGSVHVILPENSPARAGMYASAEIIIEETTALSLPLSAVTAGRNGSTTRKIEGDVVRQVKIETGIEDSGFIQIVSGLAAGDKVVEKAGAFVRDGDRIKPVEAQTNASN